MRLAQLAPLAGISGIDWYSLQFGSAASEAAPASMHLTHFADEIRDFSDTAAILRNLDLLISVDSAPVHLAGAIGAALRGAEGVKVGA